MFPYGQLVYSKSWNSWTFISVNITKKSTGKTTKISMKNILIYLKQTIQYTSSYSFWRAGIFLGEIIERCIPLWKKKPNNFMDMNTGLSMRHKNTVHEGKKIF